MKNLTDSLKDIVIAVRAKINPGIRSISHLDLFSKTKGSLHTICNWVEWKT